MDSSSVGMLVSCWLVILIAIEQQPLSAAPFGDLEEQLRRQNEELHAIRQLSSSLQKFEALDLDLSRLRRRGNFLRIVVGTEKQS